MTHIISDGLNAVQTTGHKVRSKMHDGVGAVTTELREEIDGIRHRGDGSGAKQQHTRRTRLTELAASTLGAVMAFFVTRLVNGRLRTRKR